PLWFGSGHGVLDHVDAFFVHDVLVVLVGRADPPAANVLVTPLVHDGTAPALDGVPEAMLLQLRAWWDEHGPAMLAPDCGERVGLAIVGRVVIGFGHDDF